MDDSGTILCYISSLKDMLDQVNEEIELNIQITREIESEIVKCRELESTLVTRESELTKTLYVSQFEINGLVSVTKEARKSIKLLDDELCNLRTKRKEILNGIDSKREQFCMMCIDFQRDINKAEDEELVKLLSEKELIENEISLMDEKNDALKNSMLAFVEDVLQDLQDSNTALYMEIQNRNNENEKLLKDIDDLKTTLHSRFNCHHS